MPLFQLAIGAGSGTVTSVGLTAPSSILAVAGSPVTTAGVLALALVAQTANFVWAGPTTGSPADPAFRALVAADIPDLSSVYQPLSAKLTAFAALADSAGFLKNDGAGVYSWAAAGGDFSGPASATDNAIVRFDGTTGKLGQNSLAILDDSGNLAIAALTITTGSNPAVIVNKTGSGPANILVQLAGADAATWGVANGAGQGVAGSVAGDFFIKPAAGAVHLSTDDGTTVGFRVKATNVIQFPTYGAGVLVTDSSGNVSAATSGVGTGTVTSVALTLPGFLSVTGSPVTTAGTLAITLATQSANLVFAGPGSGGAATPTFRSLVAADIPDLSATYQPLNAKLTAIAALANAAGILTNDGSGVFSYVAASTGTVTSVSLTAPSFLSVGGSPVTTSGTLALTLATQTANTVFAGPTTGAAAAPTFRALVAADFPSIPATTFTMATARILGRTTAGTGAVEELTAGTSLSLSSGSLNTIQGIRTSDTPQFASLGIGVSPSVPLDITTTGTGVAVFNSSNANGGFASWKNSGSAIGDWGSAKQVVGGALGDFAITSRGGSLIFGTVVAERMRVDTSGNLGIGVTPGARLDVLTGASCRYRMSESGAALYNDYVNAAAGAWTDTIFRAVSFNWYTSTGTPTTGMTLDSSGNLGIGVAAATRLHLAGVFRQTNTANTSGFDIGLLNGSADATAYIFNRANAGLIFGANNAVVGSFNTSGSLSITGALTTGNPSGGTALSIKFGSYVGGAPGATGYQQIEINGTAYKLLCST